MEDTSGYEKSGLQLARLGWEVLVSVCNGGDLVLVARVAAVTS